LPDKDNKTEKASPHRRMEARKKGNVFQSKDLISGTTVLLCFVALRFFAGNMLERFSRILGDFISLGHGIGEFTIPVAGKIITDIAINIFILALPILLVAMALGFIMSVSQTRFIFTTEQLTPKFSRLNPVEGFKKMFSLKALVELIKSIIKVTVIIYIVYTVINSKLYQIPMLINADINAGIAWIGQAVCDVALYAGIGMMVIGVLDFLYQWWEHERSLMMSKQEVIDELKQLEGNPQVKSRIRSIREKAARQRMMAGVKTADVVIRNPEHFAVALKYDPGINIAPVVIAKGVDYLAMRIVKEAEKYNIAAVEDPPLARSLYASVEIGQEIPEEFWYAVRDIIWHLYEIKKIKPDVANLINDAYKENQDKNNNLK